MTVDSPDGGPAEPPGGTDSLARPTTAPEGGVRASGGRDVADHTDGGQD